MVSILTKLKGYLFFIVILSCAIFFHTEEYIPNNNINFLEGHIEYIEHVGIIENEKRKYSRIKLQESDYLFSRDDYLIYHESGLDTNTYVCIGYDDAKKIITLKTKTKEYIGLEDVNKKLKNEKKLFMILWIITFIGMCTKGINLSGKIKNWYLKQK